MLRKGIILILGIYILGCSTTVPIKSVRRPTIDTSGIQRLAIRPFENLSGDYGPSGAQITQYLTDQSTQIIAGTGKFTLVSPADANAHGWFTGAVKRVAVKDTQDEVKGTDKDGNPIITIRYTREVALEFSYNVFSARTEMPVGTPVSKQGTARVSSYESPAELTDPFILAKQIADSQMRTLSQDLVPHIVSTDRKLANETSKDKTVKAKMKEAQTLVKEGHYEEAIRRYDAIAAEHGSAAARTNAGILRDALASDAEATAELHRLFEDQDGLAERAAKNAAASLYANLPADSVITLIKTQSEERSMLDYTVDEITKILIRDKQLKIIDRTNQTLIDAEKQFQMSGSVSDASMVSIGHELGVQYMVFCWISGEKSLRRLNLRILNVETTEITYQEDFEI
jgi:TolB-like protein